MSKVVQVIKCGKCGKSLSEILNNKSTCDRCGTTNFIVDDFETDRLNLAINHRMQYQFTEAEKTYKSILDNTDNEKTKVMCYFGMLLSYFGVVYIKDLHGNLIITITNYKPKHKSITDTVYYKDIINSVYAENYKKDLEELEEEYQRIKKELNKGKKYDVFICSKVSLKTVKTPYIEGYTRDNEIARSLHQTLNSYGIPTFYSEIDVKGGIEYDAQILSALLRSDILLVVTTDKDYIESPWVQSEWKRWLSLMASGVKQKDSLYLTIPADKDFILPPELRKLQCYTEMKVFNKISEKLRPKEQIKTVEDLIKEANKALKYCKFETVEELAEEIIEKYNDYRGWLLLVDSLEKQRIDSKDVKYNIYIENALSICQDDKIRESIKQKYNSYLSIDKQATNKPNNYNNKINDSLSAKKESKNETIAKEDNFIIQKNTDEKNIIKNNKVNVEENNEVQKKNPATPEKLFNIGLEYHNQKEYEKAVKYYELAAKQGHEEAQNNLGHCYYYGNGVSQDYKQAVYWYELSAKQGYARAQNNLGHCYYYGRGVSQDYKQAVYWYELSAKQGYASAQNILGICYYNGRGVSQDYKQAVYWYELSAKQGYKLAINTLMSLKKYEKPKIYLENGISYINFGKYPQTIVTDKKLFKNLDIISKINKLGYIEYNGEEYKKVIASPYESGYTFINGEKIKKNKTYYFKVEPIKWRVLYNSDGTYKLLSEMILDNPNFYHTYDEVRTINNSTIYANNYEYSNIRAWLNGYNGTDYNVSDYTNKGFIDIAFTEVEKLLINSTLVDNSLSSTGDTTNNYICNNTTDKIYLLSYSDATNTSYGFRSSSSAYDVARQAQVSDYARSKGCYMYTSTNYLGNGPWWLRSPYSNSSYYAKGVFFDGNIYFNFVNYTYVGARPALEITI